MIKNCDFRQNWVNFNYFRENRASRRPYKAPDFLKSRGTALFAIFRCRGSSELTEAFCLCLRFRNGLNGQF